MRDTAKGVYVHACVCIRRVVLLLKNSLLESYPNNSGSMFAVYVFGV